MGTVHDPNVRALAPNAAGEAERGPNTVLLLALMREGIGDRRLCNAASGCGVQLQSLWVLLTDQNVERARDRSGLVIGLQRSRFWNTSALS